MGAATIVRIDKATGVGVLHREPDFAELLSLTCRLGTFDWKRTSCALCRDGEPKTVVTRLSQETLASMVGTTTRSRVSHFMNGFRKLDFVDYDGGLHVHSSLDSVVLRDWGPGIAGRWKGAAQHYGPHRRAGCLFEVSEGLGQFCRDI
jgi:hypothetical protein